MEKPSDLADLQRAVQDFCEARNWDEFHSLKNLAIGAVTEAAELVEPFRFRTDQEVDAHVKTAEGRENLQDELADVFFFLLRISQRYNVDLDRALRAKLLKNAAKYPISK
ncbi:MAG: nucleotide pyrophosphohydrolase [Deltaproteobacteria bacterium]|jgi:NTP pyrophosphatase (non-canonical NTP hydrolase)|nr:nucleotide pyrophosphohydrolase [Deltaproteobacteria bacterium]